MSRNLEPDTAARELAARIASRLAREPDGGQTPPTQAEGLGRELAALRAGLSEITQRLTHLESHVVGEGECEHEQSHVRKATGAPAEQSGGPATVGQGTNNVVPRWTSSTYVPVVHPSADRFGIGEAVNEFVGLLERDKVCTVEPGEKPCDHCSMCSSRGF